MNSSLGRLALLPALILDPLAACTPNRDPKPKQPAIAAAQPKIELLGFPDCPNTAMLRDNLTAALAAMGKGWTFADVNQEALPEGDLRRGWPTPTILVRGRDLFGMPAPTSPNMGCRVYPAGVPDAGTIAGAIKHAAKP